MPRSVSRPLLRRFWGLVRRGLPVIEAAEAVGVSEPTGRRWLAEAGGMSLLSLVTPLPCRYLSFADREAIFAGLMVGWSYAAIARSIGRSTSTVTRELDVNRLSPSRPRAVPLGERAGSRGPVRSTPNYSPSIAQQRFEARLARPKTAKLAQHDRLRGRGGS
jgi:hypothetical protein